MRVRSERERALVVRAVTLALDPDADPEVVIDQLLRVADGHHLAVRGALARLQPHDAGRMSPVTARARAALHQVLLTFPGASTAATTADDIAAI